MGIRNQKQTHHHTTDTHISVGFPEVSSIAQRSIFQKYKDTQKIALGVKSVYDLSFRNQYQKYSTHGSDHTVTVNIPEISQIFFKNLIIKESIVNGVGIGFPENIVIEGTTKPVVESPSLYTYVVYNSGIPSVMLTWEDSSITHVGYEIYRSISPISSISGMIPYVEISRDDKEYEDVNVSEGDTYYYRIQTKSIIETEPSNEEGPVRIQPPEYSGDIEWIASMGALSLWLDSSETVTISVDGSNSVTKWVDKSPKQSHAEENSRFVKPVLDSETFPLPVIIFKEN